MDSGELPCATGRGSSVWSPGRPTSPLPKSDLPLRSHAQDGVDQRRARHHRLPAAERGRGGVACTGLCSDTAGGAPRSGIHTGIERGNFTAPLAPLFCWNANLTLWEPSTCSARKAESHVQRTRQHKIKGSCPPRTSLRLRLSFRHIRLDLGLCEEMKPFCTGAIVSAFRTCSLMQSHLTYKDSVRPWQWEAQRK